MGVSNKSKFKDQAIKLTGFWMSARTLTWSCADVAGQQPRRASITGDKIFDRPDLSFVRLFSQAARSGRSRSLNPPVRPSDIRSRRTTRW